MPAFDLRTEFELVWLPNATDTGIHRLVDLLASNSPLLIHGSFTRACAMGCLATHIAWHHPQTAHLNDEAGIRWLTHVANLNPATSAVILAWDRGSGDWYLRAELLNACRQELQRRANKAEPARSTPAVYDDFEALPC